MKSKELYLKMLNAKEQHDSINFVKNYILFCIAQNIQTSADAVGVLDDETSETEKQTIMAKILLETQKLIKK